MRTDVARGAAPPRCVPWLDFQCGPAPCGSSPVRAIVNFFDPSLIVISGASPAPATALLATHPAKPSIAARCRSRRVALGVWSAPPFATGP